MKQNFLLAAALLALAGCSEPQSEAAKTTPAADAASVASAGSAPASTNQVVDCTGQPDCGLLPPNVVIVTRHQHRRDWIHPDESGNDRKQVVFEYMEGTPASTLMAVEQSMMAAGFTKVVPKDGAENSTSIAFKKAGYGKVMIWASADIGAKFKYPNAKGVLGFDFPAPAPASETAKN